MNVIIKRTYQEGQTIGDLEVFDNDKIIFTCKTIELVWAENEQRKSCIPEGNYNVVKRHSDKYGDHFHILDVANRSYILIHNANYSRQLLGCIAVGRTHTDIDRDGLTDVTSSKDTLKEMNKILPDKFELQIKRK